MLTLTPEQKAAGFGQRLLHGLCPVIVIVHRVVRLCPLVKGEWPLHFIGNYYALQRQLL